MAILSGEFCQFLQSLCIPDICPNSGNPLNLPKLAKLASQRLPKMTMFCNIIDLPWFTICNSKRLRFLIYDLEALVRILCNFVSGNILAMWIETIAGIGSKQTSLLVMVFENFFLWVCQSSFVVAFFSKFVSYRFLATFFRWVCLFWNLFFFWVCQSAFLAILSSGYMLKLHLP